MPLFARFYTSQVLQEFFQQYFGFPFQSREIRHPTEIEQSDVHGQDKPLILDMVSYPKYTKLKLKDLLRKKHV